MSTNYGTLKDNVANRIGDTSTAMKTIIGTYVNQRYKNVLRRCNWMVIDDDYAITATSASTVASASTYSLPSNFGKELYVHNSGIGEDIPFLAFDQLEQEYASTLANTSTTPSFYTIFHTTDDPTEATAARSKKIRFYPAPSTDVYVSIPYLLSPADLSSSADELVLDCETAVEYGAAADAWAYKRQFAKSQYFEGLYEKEIQNLMFDKEQQPNQVPVMNVLPLDRNLGID